MRTTFLHRNRHGEVKQISQGREIGIRDTRFERRSRFKRINYTDILNSGDPGSHLDGSGALTDQPENTGLGVQLNGSWGSFDWAGAYVWYSGKLYTINRRLPINAGWDLTLLMRIRNSPGDLSDFGVFFGVINEDDPTTGTVDGKAMGLVFGASTRTLYSSRVSNGTVTNSSVAAGSSTASIICNINSHGTDMVMIPQTPVSVALDSSDVYNAAAIANGSTAITVGISSLRWFFAFGRTSGLNLVDAVGAFDFYYSLELDPRYPV